MIDILGPRIRTTTSYAIQSRCGGNCGHDEIPIPNALVPTQRVDPSNCKVLPGAVSDSKGQGCKIRVNDPSSICHDFFMIGHSNC